MLCLTRKDGQRVGLFIGGRAVAEIVVTSRDNGARLSLLLADDVLALREEIYDDAQNGQVARLRIAPAA